MRAVSVLIVVLAVATIAQGGASRSLHQHYSSASAVSVSGGQGPFGNCGTTQTTGNAAAYASGPPCASVIIPAPPPTATCPAATVTVDWKEPPQGTAYKNLTLCTGSTVVFKWNTGKPDVKYGLYQVPRSDCSFSSSDKDVRLIITAASSPNPAGAVSATLNAPGTYYFADLNNCKQGQIQGVIISSTPASPPTGYAAGPYAGAATHNSLAGK